MALTKIDDSKKKHANHILTSLICLKHPQNCLTPPLSVSSYHFITVDSVWYEVAQCHIVLLVSYGEEVSVVETINSHTLVVALI